MQFGTLILSKKASIRSEYLNLGYLNHYEVMMLSVGKFIFQRPDTNEMIIEVDGHLHQDKPENIYNFHAATKEYFKQVIRELHQKRIASVQESIQKTTDELDEVLAKISDLQNTIFTLEQKNQESYSENREKNSRGLSKNLRKHQRRVEAIEGGVSKEKERIAKIHKEMELSLEYADTQIKMPKESK